MTVNPRAKLYCHSIQESQIKSVMDLIVENLLLINNSINQYNFDIMGVSSAKKPQFVDNG